MSATPVFSVLITYSRLKESLAAAIARISVGLGQVNP